MDKLKKNKRMRKRILTIWCMILVAGVIGTSLQVHAASKKTKAMNAYSVFLEEHPSKYNDIKDDFTDASFSLSDKSYVDEYFLYDMDKNGVPELFAYTYVNFRWHIVRVYTWKNRTVNLCKFSDGRDAIFDNCHTANGNYNFSICKKGHIHNDYYGGFTTEQYVYKGKKEKLRPFWEYRSQKNFTSNDIKQTATKNGKKITVKDFEKYTKNCKAKQLKTYSNSQIDLKLLKNGKAKVNK